MDQLNIMFMGNQDNSYTIVDLYQNNKFWGYKDSHNYYDYDVKKKLLIKNGYNQYIIRYDVPLVPLQLKIKNFYNELHTFANNNKVIFIYNDDKEFIRKCREIWNKIIELIGINSLVDFVETTLDDRTDEFITADVYKNTSFVVEVNYRSKLVIVLHSVINDYPPTSLVQHRY